MHGDCARVENAVIRTLLVLAFVHAARQSVVTGEPVLQSHIHFIMFSNWLWGIDLSTTRLAVKAGSCIPLHAEPSGGYHWNVRKLLPWWTGFPSSFYAHSAELYCYWLLAGPGFIHSIFIVTWVSAVGFCSVIHSVTVDCWGGTCFPSLLYSWVVSVMMQDSCSCGQDLRGQLSLVEHQLCI